MNNSTHSYILIVDDDLPHLRLLSNMVSKAGYEVRGVPNGSTALTVAQLEQPDLILLDILMSPLDGYAICEQLKHDKRTRDIPVIFISALDEVIDKIKAFSVGGVDYITKPFQVKEVLVRIDTHLSLRNLQKRLEEKNGQLQQEINERKQAEAKLQLTQFSVDHAGDAIFWIGAEGELLYVNEVACRSFGYSKDELLQMSFYDIDPAYAPSVWVPDWKPIQKHPVTVESYIHTKDGRVIPIESTFTYLKFEGQNYNLAFVRDITWRRWAAEELLESEERYRVIASRLKRELAQAHQIQEGMLPSAYPNWLALEAICYSAPAREVGGDFYSYEALADVEKTKYALAVGDVSGKGMPAALLMTIGLASFQNIVGQTPEPVELLIQMDQALTLHTKTTRQNCALCYVEIRPTPTGAIIRAANAGCISPLIRQAEGSIEWVDVGGLPLGLGLGTKFGYQDVTLNLAAGTFIILTSDGVVEARNNKHEMFGFERFEQAVANGPASNSEAMLAHLQTHIKEFVGDIEPHDDMTIVVVQI